MSLEDQEESRMLNEKEELFVVKKELHLKKIEVIQLRKELEDAGHKIIAINADIRSSEYFREEARRRCIRFEKLMYMMIDKIELEGSAYEDM